MPYKVAKMLEGIWTVRNDEGSVVLKCKPPYAGPPPERTEAAAGGDWTYTLDVARKAVRYARRVLPKGEYTLVPVVVDVFVGEPVAWSGNRQAFTQALQESVTSLAAAAPSRTWR